MNPSDRQIALHTAARRYCIEHHQRWAEEYVQSGLPQEKAFHLFPRYLVLEALRIEVERVRPTEAPSQEDLRNQIVGLISTADTDATLNLKRGVKNQIANQAMDQERGAFLRYIQSLTDKDLETVESLPFRRTLDGEEVNALWNRLRSRWRVDWPWYPLKEGSAPQEVLTFHTDYFHSRNGSPLLRTLLKRRGTTRLFELHEFGETDCEIDIALFTPAYGLDEGFWTTQEADWIIYASHESSLTIGGDWLLEELKRQLPDWRERQYDGPFSTGDLRGSWTTT